MKTEEILNKHKPYNRNWSEFLLPDQIEFIYKAMNEYALLVAQRALNDASENVKMKATDFYCDCGQTHTDWNVDRHSITSTPIKTP